VQRQHPLTQLRGLSAVATVEDQADVRRSRLPAARAGMDGPTQLLRVREPPPLQGDTPPPITSFLPHAPDYLMLARRNKKSPGITRALERAKGLEPSTFTLARG
jgi:hypothetical protein